MTSFTQRVLLPTKLFTTLSGGYRLDGLMVPRETAAVSAHVLCTPYNHASLHSVILFKATYVLYDASVSSSSLPVLLAEWTRSFASYCGGTDTEMIMTSN